jgi:hypothetical protein
MRSSCTTLAHASVRAAHHEHAGQTGRPVLAERDGSEGGPISEAVAKAIQEGYSVETASAYHGYFFQVLKGQGPAAPLGEIDYVIRGAMIGGFALMATPAEYGVTGVQTFIVNHNGIVYPEGSGTGLAGARQEDRSLQPGQDLDAHERRLGEVKRRCGNCVGRRPQPGGRTVAIAAAPDGGESFRKPRLGTGLGKSPEGQRPEVRAGAEAALVQGALRSVPLLRRFLTPEHEDLHLVTFEIIQRIGPPAIPLLADLLRHKSNSIRRGAINELIDLAPDTEVIQPALRRALGDEDPVVAGDAARALGALGQRASPSVGALITTLSHEDPYVRVYAAEAVGVLSVRVRPRRYLP